MTAETQASSNAGVKLACNGNGVMRDDSEDNSYVFVANDSQVKSCKASIDASPVSGESVDATTSIDDSNASSVNAANAPTADANASPLNAANGSTDDSVNVSVANASIDDSNASVVKSCVDLPNAANNGPTDDLNASPVNAANGLIDDSTSHVDLHSGITAESVGLTATDDLPCAVTQNGSHDSAQVSASAGPQPIWADHVETSANDDQNPHQHSQDSEAQHSISELSPNGPQSFESVSLDVIRESDPVSVGSKSPEVDVRQSDSIPQNDDIPAATEAIHQNGTNEESAGIELDFSHAPVHVYQESEVPEVDLVARATPDSAVAADVTDSSNVCHEPQEDILVSVISESSQADVSQSSVDQQNYTISAESLGSEESENAHSDDTHFKLEVQTHQLSLPEGGITNLEELDSSQLSEERVEKEEKAEVQTHLAPLPEGGPTKMEELDSSPFDKSEERIEEAKAEILSSLPEGERFDKCEERIEEEAKAEIQTSLPEGTNLEERDSSQFDKSKERIEGEAKAEIQTSLPEGGPTNLEELDSSQFDKSEERVEGEAKAEIQTSLPEGGPTNLEELDSSEFDESEERVEEEAKSEIQTSVPEGGPTNLEDLESSQFDKGEQRIEEETMAELLPEEQTAVVIADNCMSSLDQESKAEQSVDGVDFKALTGSSENCSELDESLAHGDTLSVAPNCHEKETDTAAKNEINQAFQESSGEDKRQHENSSLTNDVVDEVNHSETEDVGFSFQSEEKLPEIPKEIETEFEATSHDEIAVVSEVEVVELKIGQEIETEFEATAQDETAVVNEDGAVELKIDHVSAVSENPEVADSSPVSNGRGEEGATLSEVVSVTDLGEGINTCPTDIATIEFGSLSYGVPSVNDTCETDTSATQFVPSHAEIKPEVEAVKTSAGDCDDTALASKLEVSDCIVTDKIVTNSPPEINGVEEEGDQLTFLNVQDNDKPVVKESEMVDTPHSEESSASVVESSICGSLAGQDVAAKPVISPFQFMIRVPRFEELKVREHKKQDQVQLQIDEITKIRDAFRHERQKLEANRRGHAAACNAAKSNARSCKELVRSKRKEIESLERVLTIVKNAMSIDDITARIKGWEYKMQHETISLKEEKQGIREMKQLQQHRQQLSSNIGNKDEVQKAVKEREEIERRLKALRKELDPLKDAVIKADAVAQVAQKKFDDETRKLREVQKKFDEANDARQSTFNYLHSLKKELHEKNKHFYKTRESANAARVAAVHRDGEALHHLCYNQVEAVMEAYMNTDSEFRKEYVKSNMRRTVNKLGTLDGRSLNPDEEPPVLPSFVVERPDRLIASKSNVSSVMLTPSPELVDQTKTVISIDGPRTVQDGEEKNKTVKSRGVANPVTSSSSVKGTKDEISEVPRKDEISEIPRKDEISEMPRSEEEVELERKADLLRKEEEAAKLREEQKLKALEALERKKKNAEKAQQRAEIRAQKEAEQREKEREKRMRKKEKKKAEVSEIEEVCNPTVAETVKEAEAVKESKRPQKASAVSKQSKAKATIPPPLRNRSKRKVQQWVWVSVTCALVITLFVLGNVGFFQNLTTIRPYRKNGSF